MISRTNVLGCALSIGVLAAAMLCRAADAPAKQAGGDVLTLVDGEKLIGHVERASDANVTFKSDLAGSVTIEWKNVRELHADGYFAVVEKGTKFGRHEDLADIPQGNLTVKNQNITVDDVASAQPVTIPISDALQILTSADFDHNVAERPALFEDWKGSAAVGLALVLATQRSQSYTSTVALSRTLPTETWMNPESRTLVNFTSSYGSLRQPGQPLVKTSLFHARFERDQYLTQQFYLFAATGFDHDISQGLNLQQTYGAGAGWTLVKGPNDTFDLRAELTYVNQQFFTPSENQELLGSIVSETYIHKFAHNILLNEQLQIAPAITNPNAYSASGTASLTIPVLKRFAFTVSSSDAFLNDPSPGFRKNSFQFSNAITYTLP